MTDSMGDTRSVNTPVTEPVTSVTPVLPDPTDRPIPLWPEGVLTLAAGLILLAIGLRHRRYLQRKAQDIQRAVDEFQRQGGMEEIQQVARQATDLIKGAAGAGS